VVPAWKTDVVQFSLYPLPYEKIKKFFIKFDFFTIWAIG
jgi:hypothetical protein